MRPLAKPCHDVHMQLTEAGVGSRVWIDGHEMRGIRSVALSAGVDRLTVLTLEMLCTVDVEVPPEAVQIMPGAAGPSPPGPRDVAGGA